MIQFYTPYAKIWEIKDIKEKSCRVKVGTSSKNPDGSYKNSNWFAIAVGHALNQIKSGEVKTNERYAITSGRMEHISQKNEDGSWKDLYSMCIFEFANAGTYPTPGQKGSGNGNAVTQADQKADDQSNDEDLPF